MSKREKKIVVIVTVAVTLIALVVSIVSMNMGIRLPGKLTAQSADSCVELSWNAARGAQQYKIEKMINGSWTEYATVSENSFKDENVKNAQLCSYRVAAVADSSQSEYKSAECMYLQPPAIEDILYKQNGIKILWKKQKGSEKYIVYRREKTDAGDKTEKLAEIDSNINSYLDETPELGKTYAYCVCQICGENSSALNEKNGQITFAPPVKSVVVRNSPDGAKVTWNGFKGAESYTVMRKADGEKQWSIAGSDVSGTEYVDSSCPYHKKVSYKIAANLPGGASSVYSKKSTFYSVDPNKKMVALTYDDGPYRPVTEKILSACKKYDARVTFFVVGSRVDTYSDCVQNAAKFGCEIGTHTYNHTILTRVTPDVMKNEVSMANDVVEKYTKKKVRVIRCPGGFADDTVKATIKYPLINWNVDTMDWKTKNTSSTISGVKNCVSDGSIVLMHDLYDSTGNAADAIMKYLTDNGYQIVTVSEMLDAKGLNPSAGTLYYSGRK